MHTFLYNIYNLLIESELEIPEALESEKEQGTVVDISLKFGTLPDHLENITSSGVLFEISDGRFLLKLPTIGKYLAEKGNEIIMDPRPETTEDEIRLFLLGSVMGAILHQRGYLPLHGSSVNVNDEALVVIGNSATGKSTLSAALDRKGYPLISDDLSVLSLDSEEICRIHPGIRSVKLWRDVVDQLHPDTNFKKVRPQIQKFRVPAGLNQILYNPLPVKKVILLTTRNKTGFGLEEISGANKLKILRENIYRDQVIKGLGLMKNHFHLLAQLSNQSRLFHIQRPSSPLLIDELAEFVTKNVF